MDDFPCLDGMGLIEALRELSDSLRVVTAEDGEVTIDTCYLTEDLLSVIRRLEQIRDGAWCVPALRVSISLGDLTGLAEQLLSIVQELTEMESQQRAANPSLAQLIRVKPSSAWRSEAHDSRVKHSQA